MTPLIIEPHYLGSLEYFALLQQNSNVEFEVYDTFKKQTFRNRAYLLGSNKILPITVPLTYSNRTITKDVVIDYNHNWIKNHWGALYSSYGKAPFFEYFQEDFKTIWERRPKFLIDLIQSFQNLVLKILKLDIEWKTTSEYQKTHSRDYRDCIEPKTPYTSRKIYSPSNYTQLFGDNFTPNLSIIDLVMCEGPQAANILSASILGDE